MCEWNNPTWVMMQVVAYSILFHMSGQLIKLLFEIIDIWTGRIVNKLKHIKKVLDNEKK